jgi:seryl-tRNA synthetase
MLDPQLLRTRIDWVAERLLTRGPTAWIEERQATEHSPHTKATFEALENQRKAIQIRTQELQTQRNTLSKQIGQGKSKGEDVSALMAEVGSIGNELKKSEDELGEVLARFNAFVATLPNIPHESVPAGQSPDQNVEVRALTPCPDFAVRDHVDLGEGSADRFRGRDQIAGARFTLLSGPMAPCIAPSLSHADVQHCRARLHRSLRSYP